MIDSKIIRTEISENKKTKIFGKNAFNAISRRRRVISTQLIEGGPVNIFDKKAGLGTRASSISIIVEINVPTIFSS